MVGRLDEYLAVAGKGYAIDPLLGPVVDSYTWALMDHRQFDKTIEVIEQWNRSMNPEDVLAFWDETYWKIIPMMASGNTTGAIAMASKLGPEHMTIPVRDAIIGLLENPANVQAREVLRTAISGDNISQYDFDAYTSTLVLLHTGDVDFVIERTIADAQNFSFGNVEPLWSPIYARFRQHPRFGEYLELLNLPEYWDQASWPDLCRRVDAERIECE